MAACDHCDANLRAVVSDIVRQAFKGCTTPALVDQLEALVIQLVQLTRKTRTSEATLQTRWPAPAGQPCENDTAGSTTTATDAASQRTLSDQQTHPLLRVTCTECVAIGASCVQGGNMLVGGLANNWDDRSPSTHTIKVRREILEVFRLGKVRQGVEMARSLERMYAADRAARHLGVEAAKMAMYGYSACPLESIASIMAATRSVLCDTSVTLAGDFVPLGIPTVPSPVVATAGSAAAAATVTSATTAAPGPHGAPSGGAHGVRSETSGGAGAASSTPAGVEPHTEATALQPSQTGPGVSGITATAAAPAVAAAPDAAAGAPAKMRPASKSHEANERVPCRPLSHLENYIEAINTCCATIVTLLETLVVAAILLEHTAVDGCAPPGVTSYRTPIQGAKLIQRQTQAEARTRPDASQPPPVKHPRRTASSLSEVPEIQMGGGGDGGGGGGGSSAMAAISRKRHRHKRRMDKLHSQPLGVLETASDAGLSMIKVGRSSFGGARREKKVLGKQATVASAPPPHQAPPPPGSQTARGRGSVSQGKGRAGLAANGVLPETWAAVVLQEWLKTMSVGPLRHPWMYLPIIVSTVIESLHDYTDRVASLCGLLAGMTSMTLRARAGFMADHLYALQAQTSSVQLLYMNKFQATGDVRRKAKNASDAVRGSAGQVFSIMAQSQQQQQQLLLHHQQQQQQKKTLSSPNRRWLMEMMAGTRGAAPGGPDAMPVKRPKGRPPQSAAARGDTEIDADGEQEQAWTNIVEELMSGDRNTPLAVDGLVHHHGLDSGRRLRQQLMADQQPACAELQTGDWMV